MSTGRLLDGRRGRSNLTTSAPSSSVCSPLSSPHPSLSGRGRYAVGKPRLLTPEEGKVHGVPPLPSSLVVCVSETPRTRAHPVARQASGTRKILGVALDVWSCLLCLPCVRGGVHVYAWSCTRALTCERMHCTRHVHVHSLVNACMHGVAGGRKYARCGRRYSAARARARSPRGVTPNC
jgi:hypothetical protein